MERRGSLHLDVLRENSAASSATATVFEPIKETSITGSPESSPVEAPEKRLTLFALRLAILEKAATGVGTLGFIWATVVLLGGFAITLDKTDFWFITVILLIEGARIFSRSHELEWRHQATWSIAVAGISSVRALTEKARFLFPAPAEGGGVRRAEAGRKVDFSFRWIFRSDQVSKLLNGLQVASATACAVLSLMKLVRHDYGEVQKGDTDRRNRKSALCIFYSLALAEALLFLLEKAYWDWKIVHGGLFEEVNRECELGPSGVLSVRRFFYDAYSRCLDGTVFDGLKSDMISFAMDLLASRSSEDQLIGARILRRFSLNQRFSRDTLQKLGISLPAIEKLVEILNWRGEGEEEIRYSAAVTLSKLAGKKQNALRLAGIPGAVESISSLLYSAESSYADGIGVAVAAAASDDLNYDFYTFNYLGLSILKKLARDHDNCGKIANTRGLLPKIVDFMPADERPWKEDEITPAQISTIKRSLHLIKLLVRTAGRTGHLLRDEISKVVFTVSNIRNILRYGEKYSVLQQLGIEILTGLALEDDATERIGDTGGIMKELLRIFLKQRIPADDNGLNTAAGEALAMLMLESQSNCNRMLVSGIAPKLVEALETPSLRINSARILRNLCIYGGGECLDQLRETALAAPTALKAIMSEDNNKEQEVMLGLASQVFRFTNSEESAMILESTGIQVDDLARALVAILRKHRHPPAHIPRIRRFSIEMAIWIMKDSEKNIPLFRKLGLEQELDGVGNSTSDVESFDVFSGTVGISRHTTTMHTLLDTALRLLLAP